MACGGCAQRGEAMKRAVIAAAKGNRNGVKQAVKQFGTATSKDVQTLRNRASRALFGKR